jgi:hypothetical protein
MDMTVLFVQFLALWTVDVRVLETTETILFFMWWEMGYGVSCVFGTAPYEIQLLYYYVSVRRVLHFSPSAAMGMIRDYDLLTYSPLL